ncbi:MAG: c-type cytochrome [Candidatus Hydrothermarchaeales archaeon]
MAQNLPEKPTDLTETKVMRGYTDDELFLKISHGAKERGMPDFGGTLTEEEIRKVIKYIRGISK